MIPESWFAATRPDDGETVGYLQMTEDLFQPYDLMGRPQGEPAEYLEAETRLAELGLGYLSHRWKLRIEGEAAPIDVVIAEVNRANAVVRSDDPDYSGGIGVPVTVVVPVDPAKLWEGEAGSSARFTQAIPGN